MIMVKLNHCKKRRKTFKVFHLLKTPKNKGMGNILLNFNIFLALFLSNVKNLTGSFGVILLETSRFHNPLEAVSSKLYCSPYLILMETIIVLPLHCHPPPAMGRSTDATFLTSELNNRIFFNNHPIE